jgi:CheY-like chemotaxis protein
MIQRVTKDSPQRDALVASGSLAPVTVMAVQQIRRSQTSSGLRQLPGTTTPTPVSERGRRLHPSSRSRGREPVLYICGDHDGRILLAQIARRWKGLQLVVVEAARTGMRIALDHHLRLVVIDDQLPDADGAALVQHLRQRVLTIETPIIVLAHDTDPRARARYVWAGASAYFTKPLHVADVDRAVMALMELAVLR